MDNNFTTTNENDVSYAICQTTNCSIAPPTFSENGCIRVLEPVLEHEEPYFYLAQQPEAFQRRSYPNNKRREIRHFKPHVLKILPCEHNGHMIQCGTAVMKFVDENQQHVENEFSEICDMDSEKCFCFNPVAFNTSKGRYYRLQFTINFLLESGDQKTEVIKSSKFRVMSRVSSKHQ